MLSRSIDQTMYRGSRAVLASLTCRQVISTPNTPFPATEDVQARPVVSVALPTSAIFSPMESMGLVLELIYPHRREKRSREREGVNYIKSRDGYWDCSSDHVNYDALAAASPSTSECWHARLPEPPCLGPAEKDCMQMIYHPSHSYRYVIG